MSDAAEAHTIFLVTGKVQGGKSTFLTELVEELKMRGLKVGGFLAPGSFDSERRSGFRLKNISTGKELAMASAHETAKWIKYRRFWFNPDAFRQGMEWIRLCLSQKTDVVVIDEVGPMEMEGSGWAEILEYLKSSPLPIKLWCVRESLLREVMKRWDIPESHIIHIENTKLKQAADRIGRIIK